MLCSIVVCITRRHVLIKTASGVYKGILDSWFSYTEDKVYNNVTYWAGIPKEWRDSNSVATGVCR